MAAPLGIASILTNSPVQTALGFLSKKKNKKAKKKAKRKAKRQRQQIADNLEMQGVAPAQARQMANQQVASGGLSSMAVANTNADGTEKNFLMKDYLGIGIPTIPLAGGIVLIGKQLGLFGKAKRTYRRRSSRRRKR